MNDKPTINPQTLPPLTRFIYTLGQLPTSYLMSMSFEEQLVWLCNYLGTQVIPAVNQNGEAVEELQNLYELLRTYVNDYFDNLDVQEEINNKLNEMSEDGSLTSLIKNYIDPLYQTYENNINNTISSMQSQINSVASGSPKGVYETINSLETADPNHNNIYVVSEDGKWYYYDTTSSSWKAGGTYQSTLENYDKTLTLDNHVANSKSIGDKINNNVVLENLFNKNDILDNYQINNSGEIVPSNSYFISNIMKLNTGDTIYCNIWKNTMSAKSIAKVAKVDALGNVLSVEASDVGYYTADANCFIKIVIYKSNFTTEDYQNYLVIAKNTPTTQYIPYNFKLINDEKGLNDISEYLNYFNSYTPNSTILETGILQPQNNYFVTNLIPCANGDNIYLKYFNNDTSIKLYYGILYDENMHLSNRITINAYNYQVTHTGYIKFVCSNPNGKNDLLDYLTISINKELTDYVPYKRFIINKGSEYTEPVSINKIDDNNFRISFGDFKITLFKTENDSTNSNNWNIKEVTDKLNNIIVPTGTDIIGPIKVNNNSDFIGGVHGDETTDNITISINNNSYDIKDITQLSGKSMTIIMKSSVYDESTKNKVADRYVNLIFSSNKIHISNSYKFVTNTLLNLATNGGLIACRNNIIKDIIMNNSYFETAPETPVSNSSNKNTFATINTIYGSVSVVNIKGYENSSYTGYLQVFTNETPKRCKIYFLPYKLAGGYNFTNGDEITGEFEYIFS